MNEPKKRKTKNHRYTLLDHNSVEIEESEETKEQSNEEPPTNCQLKLLLVQIIICAQWSWIEIGMCACASLLFRLFGEFWPSRGMSFLYLCIHVYSVFLVFTPHIYACVRNTFDRSLYFVDLCAPCVCMCENRLLNAQRGVFLIVYYCHEQKTRELKREKNPNTYNSYWNRHADRSKRPEIKRKEFILWLLPYIYLSCLFDIIFGYIDLDTHTLMWKTRFIETSAWASMQALNANVINAPRTHKLCTISFEILVEMKFESEKKNARRRGEGRGACLKFAEKGNKRLSFERTHFISFHFLGWSVRATSTYTRQYGFIAILCNKERK